MRQITGKKFEMRFIKETNRIYAEDETGKTIAEVTFPEFRSGVVVVDHTFVDESLRGMGVAGQLMEECHNMLEKDGRKAVLTCPYAVKWYVERPENKDVLENGTGKA
jgi:predicted GNAT family acetyltransferase